MTSSLRGREGFETFYSRAFGERWRDLRPALTAVRAEKIMRVNAFSHPADRDALERELTAGGAPGCFLLPSGVDARRRDRAGLSLGYVMDVASVLCARALPLGKAMDVLDLCAAPGGKSLVLAEGLSTGARLTCNDRSPARRERLRATLTDYLPPEVRARVTVTGFDGRRVGVRAPERFDAVLLDAPCSSESHVLRDSRALDAWSPRRPRQLARDQYALLTSALLSLRPGGVLVYSTCALLDEENDGVIRRLLERGRHTAVVERPQLGGAESRAFGQQFLPDRSGWGPLYVCVLRKAGSESEGSSSTDQDR